MHDHHHTHGTHSPDNPSQLSLALTAGYIAAFQVNYVLVGKGIRHVH